MSIQFLLLTYRASSQYGVDGVKTFLDANENNFGSAIPESLIAEIFRPEKFDLLGCNRYPDPRQLELRQHLCTLRNDHSYAEKTFTTDHVYVAAGANEVIDALIRCFCVPGRDKILTCPPTYDMYSVSARVNDVGVVKVPLLDDFNFKLSVESISATLSREPNIKIVCLASLNNPTGTSITQEDIVRILQHPTWNGIVALDEAYIDYSSETTSRAEWVAEWPNLVVIQTMSKAYRLAGIRLGAAFTSPSIDR